MNIQQNQLNSEAQTKKILAAVAITALIVSGLAYGLFHSYDERWTIIQTTTPIAATSSSITVGQPCDFNAIQDTSDTKGLQCYLYGPGSETRSGVWIKPNHVEGLNFFEGVDHPATVSSVSYNEAISFVTKKWNTYTSPDKSFSFKYPSSQWRINTDVPNEVILSGDPNFDATNIRIQYFPVTNFNQIPDGQLVPTRFPDGSSSFNDKLQYLQDFKLDGKQAYGIIQLPSVARGGDPESVTVYIVSDHGYLEVTYTRYNDFSKDNLPTEAFLKTIHIK
jgi:hypothetical protein